jgi:mannose-1-phosphate guanylyltransferase
MRYAMIMAGGSGTRLWPMSRNSKPKQLLPLIDGQSLLSIAAQRIQNLVPQANRYICTAERDRAAIRAQIPWLDDAHILGEPMGRDTVNAVALGAAVLSARDTNAVFAVLTSDHLIQPEAEFERAMELGFKLVEADPRRLVTFAVKPSFAATAYGYVEQSEPISGFPGAFNVSQLIEKPSQARAEEYLAAGTFGWNSGMFVFNAKTVLNALERLKPEVATGMRQIGAAWATPAARATLDRIYPTLPKISVDYALMEPAVGDPALQVCVVPMSVSWRDVGSWSSYADWLAECKGGDAKGNFTNAHAVHAESTGTVAVSDDPSHSIATIGLDNIIIVHTKDATLVMRKDMAEKVKDVASLMPDHLR